MALDKLTNYTFFQKAGNIWTVQNRTEDATDQCLVRIQEMTDSE